MANPWLKKNPFMSLWLSSANRVAGSLRGHSAAEAKRQATLATQHAANDLLKFWTTAATASTAPTASARRRKVRK